MALNSLGLGFVFSAKDMASPVLRKVEGRFKKMDATTAAAAAGMDKSMAKLGVGFAMAAAGAIGLGLAAKSAAAFGEYEQELARVGAITRATAEDLDVLGARAIKAGIETQFSPTEAVKGLTELGLRGLNAAQSTEALGGALDFAAGASIGVAQGSSTMAAALKVFSKDADFATEAADKLLKISNITAIQGGDLELMLGNVSRGAIAAGQGMDEMLVAMGLVRNAGIDAAKASSSVSSGLQFIAKNQDAFKDLGVSVEDADGNFRNFMDIVLDTDKALKDKIPSAAKRTKASLELFGRFGVSSFGAITAQVTNGIQTLTKGTLFGAEAIEHLRGEMADAAGTAKKFRDQILDTFEGQKTLLEGSMQTLAVSIGESFAAGFRPIVETIKDGVNLMIGVLQLIPTPLKKVIGILFVLVSAMLLVGGTIVLVTAMTKLMGITMVAFKAIMVSVATGFGIAILAGVALWAMFRILKNAFDKNIGGFGDKVKEIFGKVKLYFDAIGQLMSGDGKLSGSVLKKMLDPANNGVLSLVGRFQQLRFRVMKFWDGLKSGFSGVMSTMEPVFSALGNAFNEFMNALGFGSKGVELFTGKSQTWADSGERIGEILARVATIIVNLLTGAIYVATGAVEGLKLAWSILKYPVMAVMWAFGLVADILNVVLALFGMVTQAGDGTDNAFTGLGKTMGFMLKMWIAWKALILANTIRLKALNAVALITGKRQLLIGTTSKIAQAASAGPMGLFGTLGLAAAVFAASFAIGTLLDDWLGISDKIAGVTNSSDFEDEAAANAAGLTKDRSAPGIASAEAKAANDAGLTIGEYRDKQAAKLSKEVSAEGFDTEALIRQRLEEGTDIFAKMSKDEMKQFATSGTDAKKDGEADAGKRRVAELSDGIERGMTAANSKSRTRDGKQEVNVAVHFGDEQVADSADNGRFQRWSDDFEQRPA